MTKNKPIIINGVDVSGCDFYDKNKKYCLTLKMDTTGFKNPSCFSGDFQKCIQDSKTCPYTFCDNNPNCYFKQLTRKMQECEKKSWEIGNLGYKIKNQRKEINERLKQLKAKEQECEILKQSENEAKEIIAELKAENKQLKRQVKSDKGLITNAGKQNYQLIQEYDKLKVENEQAEQKLEKIRELAISLCYKKIPNGAVILQEDILQIIDEME